MERTAAIAEYRFLTEAHELAGSAVNWPIFHKEADNAHKALQLHRKGQSACKLALSVRSEAQHPACG